MSHLLFRSHTPRQKRDHFLLIAHQNVSNSQLKKNNAVTFDKRWSSHFFTFSCHHVLLKISWNIYVLQGTRYVVQRNSYCLRTPEILKRNVLSNSQSSTWNLDSFPLVNSRLRKHLINRKVQKRINLKGVDSQRRISKVDSQRRIHARSGDPCWSVGHLVPGGRSRTQ